MTTLTKIARYIEATSSRLDDLALRARGAGDPGRPILQESLIHLASTLEELRVSEEELRAQAEGLASSHFELEAELRRYRGLFEQAPDAYLVTDGDGVIREANAAAAALLGVHGEALRGKPLALFVAGDDRRAFRALLPWLREAASLRGVELVLVPRGGEPVRVEASVAAVRGEGGTPGELRMVLRDASARRPEAPARIPGPPVAVAVEVPAVESAPVRPEARAWGEAFLREARGTVDRRSRAAAAALAELLGRSVSLGLYLGLLRPGDRVPGIREVARATGLNHKTVARAYREMEAQGVLQVRDRSGVYAAPLGWTDGALPAGDESWAAEVMTEAWRRRIGVPALPETLRRWTAAAPLRCAVVESDPARREALCAEVGGAFGLECLPLSPEDVAGALASGDLVVTTPFHAARLRAEARALGKPLIVTTARAGDLAAAPGSGSDAVPLPGLSDDTARSLSETLILLNRERAAGHEPAAVLPG